MPPVPVEAALRRGRGGQDGEDEEEGNTASRARRHLGGGARRWHEQQHTARPLFES